MAETNTTEVENEETSNDDLADLALGDQAEEADDDESGGDEEEKESFWGNFKSYVPQARELEELRATLTAKEKELAAALSSRKLQLEDLFDESVVKGLPAEDIEELAAALYFTVHPDKVDQEIAKGIKAKRESIAEKRRRDQEAAEIRSKAEEAANIKAEADIRTYQADLRETIVDMESEIPYLLKMAGSRAELSRLVFDEVLEAVEAGVAKTADDIDPKEVLAGLERRARKAMGRAKPVTQVTSKKTPVAKAQKRRRLGGIYG